MTQLNRILIVDNHPLFRKALHRYLSQEPDFQIVGMAGSMRDAIWSVASLHPDLVLTELSMPDARGVEAVTGIKHHYPDVKVLVLSFYRENEFALRCREAGAEAYLVKDAIHDDLCATMRAVLDHGSLPHAGIACGTAPKNGSRATAPNSAARLARRPPRSRRADDDDIAPGVLGLVQRQIGAL